MNLIPILQTMLAAALFGASVPISKLLLGEIDPIPMAFFLYLGSGIGLFFFRFFQGKKHYCNEAKVTKSDVPWIIGAILAGGILAPIVLMFSLKNAPASTASLLLNFEGVATTVIAVVAFKEAVGERIWGAVILITMASILLSWDSSGQWGLSIGAVGVMSACVLWGIDNNFIRHVSAKDPLSIVMIKGLSAGTFSLILSLVLGYSFPSIGFALRAMLLGCFSYGLSIVLFIRAMRELGSARTSALFGTAPFVGTILSVIIFKESLNTLFFLSIPIMIIGTVLLLKEKHGHLHEHKFLVHEHRHSHDSHHTHPHPKEELPKGGYHSHEHGQEPTAHEHPHTPDIHHRHVHQN
ncbi:MAG: multidrug DMT transporter [Desulfosporosinus sp. BRH_c37]|nr:MAG: multidrug DMT transporter [Desulfosporosinus sp. BRH_c37]